MQQFCDTLLHPTISLVRVALALMVNYCMLYTFLWAAACFWTAWAANIAAAILRAALTAADTEKNDQQQRPKNDQQHSQPI